MQLFLHRSRSGALWGCRGAAGLFKQVNILREGGNWLGFNMLAHGAKRKHLEQMAGLVGRDGGNSSIHLSTAWCNAFHCNSWHWFTCSAVREQPWSRSFTRWNFAPVKCEYVSSQTVRTDRDRLWDFKLLWFQASHNFLGRKNGASEFFGNGHFRLAPKGSQSQQTSLLKWTTLHQK